ncbi:MAG: type VI secretion system tip protein VgrG [Bacteroidetes bacterium]|nr:type VI secretion system tip protein VgrG [Bacteroidota bacterium]
MSLTSLIPGATDTSGVIAFSILFDGTPISGETEVVHITVSKSFNKISSATIVIRDGSAATRDFPVSDSSTMVPGTLVTIGLGYHGSTDTIFEGVVVKHALKIRPNGASMLVIEAKDKAVKLIAARKSAYFIDKTDSDVITQLAGDSTPQVDSTSVSHPQLIQFDTTDWDFICTRAEANGMLVLTDDGNLIVKKPTTSSPSILTATFGDTIFEFDAEMDARRQMQSVASHAWDYTKQQVLQSEPGSATFDENGNIPASTIASVVGADVELRQSGNRSNDELNEWSNAYALRSVISKSVGRVRIQGTSLVKPGNMITLDGVGDRFNGNVFVSGVLHTFDGEWRTDIQFGWKSEWFFTKEGVTEKPAAGLVAGVNGLQIGLVLDTNDSDGQYRVKVSVPTITSGNEGLWARVATLDAGAKRGTYFRPQPNDEVVLGFLDNDPREPIILGYLHSSSSHESPFPETSGKEQYGILTKAGTKVMFDDSVPTLTLLVKASAGEKSIVINDDTGALIMKDENQNSIKMDATGITISSSSGIVTIKGSQVLIN